MEDKIEVPQSFWERLVADKRKLALAVVGAVVIVALVGVGIWAALGRDTATTDTAPRDGAGTVTPADDATNTMPASGEETSSAGTTTTAGTTPTPSGTSGGSGPTDASSPPIKPAPLIAYRAQDALWVATDSGGSAREVGHSRGGAFALAPDGKTLAYVDVDERALFLADVATGKPAYVGPAADADLSWAPDSSFVVYTATKGASAEVCRVARDGSGASVLASGHSGRVSSDGKALVWVADAASGQPGKVAVALLGKTASPSYSPDVMAEEVTYGLEGIVATVREDSGAGIVTEKLSGYAFGSDTRATRLPIKTTADKPGMLAHLLPSLQGRYLMFAEVGDDGYSRAYVYDTTTKRSVALSVRRDTSPMGWSADGGLVHFVEGNAFQGEKTDLLSANPDGTGRKVLVAGAGL